MEFLVGAMRLLPRLFLWENLEHIKGEGKGAVCLEQETFKKGITEGQGIEQMEKNLHIEGKARAGVHPMCLKSD